MNVLYFLSRILIILSLMFVINNHTYSQNSDTTDLISVRTYIVGKGAEYLKNYYEHDKNSYFTLTVVTNNQDTAISFFIMGASWMVDNFEIDNDSIYFRFLGNDANSPVKIKLLPHKSVSFNALIRARNEKITNRYFKVGFRFTDLKDFSFPEKRKKSNNGKTYWSNKIKLEHKGFRYEVEDN